MKKIALSFAMGAAISALACLAYPREPAQSAAPVLPSVAAPTRFETFALALPKLAVDRAVRVYLPPDYASCTTCRYPVVYFMDGQNVFDAATSYAGEWGADEVLDDLHQQYGLAVIAVALDHGSEARTQELSVWPNPKYAPAKGEAYLADLIDTVKPAIDARYRTRPDAQSTSIVGSSMGGLMAHAAVMRHASVFGNALVFSPSYWFSSAIAKETARKPLQPGQRVYIYIGGSEGGGMLPDAEAVATIWKATLPNTAALHFKAVAEAEHNEAAWRHVLPEALCWTLQCTAQTQKP